MLAEYRGYWGTGTRMPSLSFLMIAFSMYRTAGEAPSVRKICCTKHNYVLFGMHAEGWKRSLPSFAPASRQGCSRL